MPSRAPGRRGRPSCMVGLRELPADAGRPMWGVLRTAGRAAGVLGTTRPAGAVRDGNPVVQRVGVGRCRAGGVGEPAMSVRGGGPFYTAVLVEQRQSRNSRFVEMNKWYMIMDMVTYQLISCTYIDVCHVSGRHFLEGI